MNLVMSTETTNDFASIVGSINDTLHMMPTKFNEIIERLEKVEKLISKLGNVQNIAKPINSEQSEVVSIENEQIIERFQKLLNICNIHGIPIRLNDKPRENIKRIENAIEQHNRLNFRKFFTLNYIIVDDIVIIGPVDQFSLYYKDLIVRDRIFDIEHPLEFLTESFRGRDVTIGNLREYQQKVKEDEIARITESMLKSSTSEITHGNNQRPKFVRSNIYSVKPSEEDDEQIFKDLLKKQSCSLNVADAITWDAPKTKNNDEEVINIDTYE